MNMTIAATRHEPPSYLTARLGLAAERRDLMPDPPRRYPTMRQAEHEAAVSVFGDDPDDRFGIPLFRARACLVAETLWKAALKASVGRANPGWRDSVPGSPWRYEVFTPKTNPPREGWASWKSQEANAFYRFEAERQDIFYKVSLELGRRLLGGQLEAHGRVGHIAGPWAPIPASAWAVLEVPFLPDFKNWRVGYATAQDSSFWGVRIQDKTGLSLRAAALAYGPPEASSIAQRAAAFGIAAETASSSEAWQTLRLALQVALQAGRLVAMELRHGKRSIIPISFWNEAAIDLDASSRKVDSVRFAEIRLFPELGKPALPTASSSANLLPSANDQGAPAATRPSPTSKPCSDQALRDFYLARVSNWSPDRPPPSGKDDAAEAQLHFGSDGAPSRDRLREIRRNVAPLSWQLGPGRPKKSRT